MVVVSRYLLAPDAYRSQSWFDREQHAVFTNRWCPVADEAQLVEPGAYVAATVGLAPLLVVRGDDGELRAFQNLCRHRGMVLLEGQGHCGRAIDCFYHQWRYGLAGDLQLVPQRKDQFPDLDPDRWGLLPASVGVWEGIVFAHPDPDAAPLADFVAPLADNIGSHRPGLLQQVARVDLDAACNWKLFVENHIDVYHLWYLHSETLGDFDHTRFEHVTVGGDWFSYEPLRNGDLESSRLRQGTTAIAHLDERDRIGIGAHMLFPNVLVATSSEFFMTYQAVPVAPDRTRIEVRIRAEAGADADVLVAAARSFIDEDILACERVQAGLGAPAFSIGPLATDHEAPITRFQEHLLAELDR
jgi:Rieske 2Fe-2S family protein